MSKFRDTAKIETALAAIVKELAAIVEILSNTPEEIVEDVDNDGE